MPRLFVGNFDFEHQLARSETGRPSAKIEAINRQLLPSLLVLAERGDYLWLASSADLKASRQLENTCDTPPAELIPVIETATKQGVCPIWRRDQLPLGPQIELRPWGWTAALMQVGELFGWRMSAPPLERVHWANSRSTSYGLEQAWNLAPPGSAVCRNWEELETALQGLSATARWVIKAEFGMSARERILGTGPVLTTGNRNWAEKRWQRGEPLFLEPWLQRLEERSYHYEIAPDGTVRFLGALQLLTDHLGRYRENQPLPHATPPETDPTSADWETMQQWTDKAAAHLAQGGYFGPLGIDTMRYETPGPSPHTTLRPLQDINARLTMGYLTSHKRTLYTP